MIINNLERLDNYTLQNEDIVTFDVSKISKSYRILKYHVCDKVGRRSTYLEISVGTNNLIFDLLGLSSEEKNKMAACQYGYPAVYQDSSVDTYWPPCKKGDVEALTKLVKRIYVLIDVLIRIYVLIDGIKYEPINSRFEILDIR